MKEATRKMEQNRLFSEPPKVKILENLKKSHKTTTIPQRRVAFFSSPVTKIRISNFSRGGQITNFLLSNHSRWSSHLPLELGVSERNGNFQIGREINDILTDSTREIPITNCNNSNKSLHINRLTGN